MSRCRRSINNQLVGNNLNPEPEGRQLWVSVSVCVCFVVVLSPFSFEWDNELFGHVFACPKISRSIHVALFMRAETTQGFAGSNMVEYLLLIRRRSFLKILLPYKIKGVWIGKKSAQTNLIFRVFFDEIITNNLRQSINYKCQEVKLGIVLPWDNWRNLILYSLFWSRVEYFGFELTQLEINILICRGRWEPIHYSSSLRVFHKRLPR